MWRRGDILAVGTLCATLAVGVVHWLRASAEEEVEAARQYWFGSAPLAELQRSLWFSRGASRDRADVAIRERFGRLVNRLWAMDEGRLHRWASRCPRLALGSVVVLDQLARHAWRGDEGYEQRTLSASARAARLFEACFGALGRWDACLELSPAEHAFGLLAGRHAGDETAIRAALAGVEERRARDADQAQILERFRKATERRLRVARSTTADASNLDGYEGLLEVAESVTVDEDAPTAVGEVLRTWVVEELRCRGWEAAFGTARSDKSEVVVVAVVSLSGGVDSMVATRALALLRDRCRLRRAGDAGFDDDATFGVWCVHVDYGNRPESGLEASFLRDWCSSIRVRLDVMEMPASLRRRAMPREEYETQARDVRFALYRRVQAEAGSRPAALLGHHRGDLEENCLSNCLRGASVLDLAGMRADDELHGARVARPLLAVDKSQIYQCARALGVPWFKDSTPKWSTRGRLRDEVLPLLRDVYGAGCGRNLEKVARESEALKRLCDDLAFGPFSRAAVSRGALGTRVQALGYRDRDALFWRTVARRIAHDLGLGALSDKALKVLVGRLKGIPGVPPKDVFARTANPQPCSGWLELKRDWDAYLDARGVLYVFRPRPPRAEGRVALGAPPARLGAWTVEARWDDDLDDDFFEPASFDRFFLDGQVRHGLSLDASRPDGLQVAPLTLRRYPPFRALDALLASPKLRNIVPILAPNELCCPDAPTSTALTWSVHPTPPPPTSPPSSAQVRLAPRPRRIPLRCPPTRRTCLRLRRAESSSSSDGALADRAVGAPLLVLDEDASVHDHGQTGGFGGLKGAGMDHLQLRPHRARVGRDGILHDTRKILGPAEDVDDIHSLRNLVEGRVRLDVLDLAHGRVHWVDRVVVAKVHADPVRLAAGLIAVADHSYHSALREQLLHHSLLRPSTGRAHLAPKLRETKTDCMRSPRQTEHSRAEIARDVSEMDRLHAMSMKPTSASESRLQTLYCIVFGHSFPCDHVAVVT